VSLVFVDTNVLLYGVDEKDSVKRERAQAWLARCWKRQCGRLSTQVLNEFYVNVRRKFRGVLSEEGARAEIRRYQTWRPWTIDQQTVESAWAVESRFGFNYWDALMVAAAHQQGCAIFLSEDLQHDQQLDGVRVLNPFITAPEVLDGAP
jgi:predicted nucleic acid-binding protein